MALPTTAHFGEPRRDLAPGTPLVDTSAASPTAVSWPAIFAGAAGAAALSLILLVLGTGLDLSSTSPWERQSMGPSVMGAQAIAWVVFTQVVASGMGGYLAGRLRTRWAEVQRDEVHFRDTAHGFLAWAVAALVTATMLTQVAGAITQPGMPNRMADGNHMEPTGLDQRFTLAPYSEAAAMNGVRHAGQLLTAQRTALPQQDDLAAQRKASAHSALWVFVALLSGAFAASLAATLGGRQRDA